MKLVSVYKLSFVKLSMIQHSATAQILQDIGAIEFLSQLRADVSKSLQPVIDEILENTMRLPEVPEETYAPTCVYQKQGYIPGLLKYCEFCNILESYHVKWSSLLICNAAMPSSFFIIHIHNLDIISCVNGNFFGLGNAYLLSCI